MLSTAVADMRRVAARSPFLASVAGPCVPIGGWRSTGQSRTNPHPNSSIANCGRSAHKE
jgi:hypothetical protein